MTSEERIEALTQSVELLSQMHQDSEEQYAKQVDRLITIVEKLSLVIDDHERRIAGGFHPEELS